MSAQSEPDLLIDDVDDESVDIINEPVDDIVITSEEPATVVTSAVDCNRAFRCEEEAREGAGCSDGLDGPCMCDETTYLSSYYSCFQSDLECYDEWSLVTDSHTESCSPYELSAHSVCLSCQTSAIEGAACLDEVDFPCLCPLAISDDHISRLWACQKTASSGSIPCPSYSMAWLEASFTDGCFALTDEHSFLGCPQCQSSIATELDCTAPDDFDCICSVERDYIRSLTPCVTETCFLPDLTLARSSITDACMSIRNGLTPAKQTPVGNPRTGDDRDSENPVDNSDEEDGPDTVTVVGIVVGAIGGLSLLLIGGYFIFRKSSDGDKKLFAKKEKKPAKTNKLPTLPSRPDGTTTKGTVSVAELVAIPKYNHHEMPGLPQRTPPPLPPRPSPSGHAAYSQQVPLNPALGFCNTPAELDSRRMNALYGNVRPRPTEQHTGFYELDTSR